MKKNILIIAGIIITVVAIGGISGGIWYFMIIEGAKRPGGLPSTNAPIQDLKIKYWNGTEKSISIQTIVDLINSGDLNEINFIDNITTGIGYNVTGVNLVELFNYLDFHAPWDVVIYNSYLSFSTDVSLMINSDGNMVKNPQTEAPLIIGIAAHNMWLAESPLGAIYGNISLFGGDISAFQAIKDVIGINITTEWSIPVYVNGYLNYTINSTTILEGDYGLASWWYDDNGTEYFDWNCTLKGRTLSSIISQTDATGLPYNMTWDTIDGFSWPKGGYNNTDIEVGLVERAIVNCTLDDYGDCIDGTGVPMPIDSTHAPDGNLMWVVNEQIQHQFDGPGNPTPLKLLDGGPYKTIVPGQTKKGYNKWLTRIDIEI